MKINLQTAQHLLTARNPLPEPARQRRQAFVQADGKAVTGTPTAFQATWLAAGSIKPCQLFVGFQSGNRRF